MERGKESFHWLVYFLNVYINKGRLNQRQELRTLIWASCVYQGDPSTWP